MRSTSRAIPPAHGPEPILRPITSGRASGRGTTVGRGLRRWGTGTALVFIIVASVGVPAPAAIAAPDAAGSTAAIPIPSPPPLPQPIVGFADTHLHQFANLGFGGLALWGSPMDPALDAATSTSIGASRALPASDFLYVDDTQIDDIVGPAGAGARGLLVALRHPGCTGACSPACPPGSGTPANPCWQVPIQGADGSLDQLNINLGGQPVHGTLGYPDLTGWPAWNVYTTQRAYTEWLARAHAHGLQIMTMLAVNNALICETGYHFASYGCDDDGAVDRQIAGAKALEAYIDAQAGGPGQGWYRIVHSGDEARQVIGAGKLAVVLGVEVDTPWGCTTTAAFCDGDFIRAHVQQWYDTGIRSVFPVHVTDNRFGGAAAYNDLFDLNNYFTNGSFFHLGVVCPDGLQYRDTLRDLAPPIRDLLDTYDSLPYPLGEYLLDRFGPLVEAMLRTNSLLPAAESAAAVILGTDIESILANLPPDVAQRAAIKAIAQIMPVSVFAMVALVTLLPWPVGATAPWPADSAPNCNQRGLTPEGAELVNALMDHGMIIEIDHTDAKTFDGIMTLAESRHYAGVVAGHTGLVGAGVTRQTGGPSFDLSGSARHEGNKTDAQLARLANLGATASVILDQGGRDRINQFTDATGTAASPFTCGHSSQAWAQVYLYATKTLGLTSVGIGSDINGLAGLPSPRFGRDACGGGAGGQAEGYSSTNPVSYPFDDYQGRPVAAQTFGLLSWDYNTDGFNQVGAYPDFIRDLERDGLSRADLAPLFASAEGFVHTWERAGDHDAPTVNCSDPGSGWHATDVTVTCQAFDTVSGLAVPADASFDLVTQVGANTETRLASTGARGPLCDRAGNCRTVGPFTGLAVDKRAPSVQISRPVEGAFYALDSSVTARYLCSDNGAGSSTCAGPVESGAHLDTTVGSHEFVVTSTDGVGNTIHAPVHYVVPFHDVPPGAAFFDDILWLVDHHVATGFGDGTFRPTSPVSRQAMAAFLYRSAGEPDGPTPTCTQAPFPDVPVTSPFCGQIGWLVRERIASGYADGTFRPATAVSRQAMALFLYRSAGSPAGANPTCVEAPFPDVPVASHLCGPVKWLTDQGIVAGYADGLFHPTAAVSRQAMAAFLHRVGVYLHPS